MKRIDLDRVNRVYFIGIGGIGMSALARYFKMTGKQVAGYDQLATDLTEELENDGIEIHYKEDVFCIPKAFKNSGETLVVYTPAVPNSHIELKYFRDQGFEVRKRAEILGLLTADTCCLAVAGTHGKTTTTSILGHLLYESKVKLTAFLGGISENYDTNLIHSGLEVSVVEADEFDRSFLFLSPDIACITSVDSDHLDVYEKKENLTRSFKQFTAGIKPQGRLISKKGLGFDGITYGLEDEADYSAIDIRTLNGAYVFDLKTPGGILKNFVFSIPGRHNLENAVAALSMAVEYGCSAEDLKTALPRFNGVRRRFSFPIATEDFVVIDDYAHHPEEINAVNFAIREMFPDKKVMVIFQPHLYSRTRDFADEFAKSLSAFDQVLLLDVYPAREQPIKGINSSWLLKKISNQNKALIKKQDINEQIRKSDVSVIAFLGAGDIGDEVQ